MPLPKLFQKPFFHACCPAGGVACGEHHRHNRHGIVRQAGKQTARQGYRGTQGRSPPETAHPRRHAGSPRRRRQRRSVRAAFHPHPRQAMPPARPPPFRIPHKKTGKQQVYNRENGDPEQQAGKGGQPARLCGMPTVRVDRPGRKAKPNAATLMPSPTSNPSRATGPARRGWARAERPLQICPSPSRSACR